MYKSIVIVAALLASPAAFAQGTNNQSGSQTNNAPSAAQGQQVTATIASQIRTNLEKAGFKDIRMMPSSFIVRAEDQNNNPVMMVINPDSVTAVSAVNQSGSNTVGQGSSNATSSSPAKTGQQGSQSKQ